MKFIYDRWLLLSSVTIVSLGLLMVASASMVISDQQYGYSFHYIIHQGVYLVLGCALGWLASRIPTTIWQKYSAHLFLFSLLLLLVVLIPGVGRTVNGSRRWLSLGFMSVQVSEIVKFCAILYLARYLVRFSGQVETRWIGFVKPILVLGFVAVLLLLEPDFGAFVVIASTFLGMLFLAGVPLRAFAVLVSIVAVGFAGLMLMSPYRMERLVAFMHPWTHQFGSGYQLTQSLIAFGRGGVWGVGLGNSVQKLFYLPEAHTDFLFAVLGEELGLIGEVALLALFIVLVGRMLRIGRQAETGHYQYNAYVCYGLGSWLGLQTLINLCVNIGLLPTKGLTLPLMSYGGSSLIVNCVVIGVVLRIAYENTGGDDSILTRVIKQKQRKSRVWHSKQKRKY
jgi:cell division protein FtsW